jgi:hypothetical protein
MNARTLLRGCLSPWVIIGGTFLALVLLGLTLALVWYNRPGPAPVAASTGVINVIPAPTITPIPPTPTRTPSPTPTVPVQDVPPPPAEGVITLGAVVQISGTGTDGLRLRANPGLGGTVRILGAESEVFTVTDGPQEVDGYTWWRLAGLYDETRSGWAVSNYLAVVQNP